MGEQFTEKQLNQIIVELEQLSQQQEQEYSREQISQILQELTLSPDLLDEAIIQLRRREALKIEQKQNRWLAGVIGVVLVVPITIGIVWFYQRHQAISQVYANSSQSRLTLSQQNIGNSLTVIQRQESPLIYYHVKLQQPPLNTRLNLGCNWINPLGQLEQQNRYTTRQIDRSLWNTYCRHQFDNASPVGQWQVQMTFGDRILSETEFIVE